MAVAPLLDVTTERGEDASAGDSSLRGEVALRGGDLAREGTAVALAKLWLRGVKA